MRAPIVRMREKYVERNVGGRQVSRSFEAQCERSATHNKFRSRDGMRQIWQVRQMMSFTRYPHRLLHLYSSILLSLFLSTFSPFSSASLSAATSLPYDEIGAAINDYPQTFRELNVLPRTACTLLIVPTQSVLSLVLWTRLPTLRPRLTTLGSNFAPLWSHSSLPVPFSVDASSEGIFESQCNLIHDEH